MSYITRGVPNKAVEKKKKKKEIDGKKDKKENSNFASLCTSSSQRSCVSRNVYYTMTIP